LIVICRVGAVVEVIRYIITVNVGITRITLAVIIDVSLISIRNCWAIIDIVFETIIVFIEIGLGIAGIADAILIGIFLLRVCDERAIIDVVVLFIAVKVRISVVTNSVLV